MSRISKPQPYIKLDVALEVWTPVNSTDDLCDQHLFPHLYSGNTDAVWAHLQCSCACQVGVNYEAPRKYKGLVKELIVLLFDKNETRGSG